MELSIPQSRLRAATLVRCLAAGVDLMILAILARLVEIVVQQIVAANRILTPAPIETLAEVTVVLLLSSCEFWSEVSPGKFLCGLRIRSITGDVAPIHRRVVRWSLKTIPLWIALMAAILEQHFAGRFGGRLHPYVRWTYAAASFAAVGLFVAFVPAFSRTKQTLYDMIARTAVYPAKPEHLDHHRGFEPVVARNQ